MKKKNSSVPSLKIILEKNLKISELYSKFKSKLNKSIKKKEKLVVAVSGGPDSLSLVALCKLYGIETKTDFFYVLIDHKLRKNSKKEANLVKKLLKKQNLFLHIIENTEKIEKNIQSKAREIRYKLLDNFCKKNKINTILTGHHSDDQIETFFIRLSRGSGVQGLSSMKEITMINNTRLIRPLLEFKKNELLMITKKVFGKVIFDPSNKNKKYLRTKIRSLKEKLENSGIHHDQIIRSINNLASTRDTLNEYITKTIKKCVKKKKQETLVNIKDLYKESEEIRLKILSYAIQDFSKSYYPPRSKKVLNVISTFKKKLTPKVTLGGCFIEKSGNYLSIKKEV